ncbi:hypothetical protein H5410_032210 [Solanum commersonii]|uniref:Uncharacterized protein n=1 Tax=Solanum commersonii TaxID=4109 RepID=A0A9J5YMA7_SOLCO|nr:hypothetical protein H5410_032210 [Solanum commersonii]
MNHYSGSIEGEEWNKTKGGMRSRRGAKNKRENNFTRGFVVKINFLSWNVRGLNGERESKRALLTRNDSNLYQQIWNNIWLGEAHVEASGRSGGIVVLWDKRVWKGEMVDSGNQMLTLGISTSPDIQRREQNKLPKNQWCNDTVSEWSMHGACRPSFIWRGFTWKRSENHESASRIARLLYSSQWEEQYLHIKQSLMLKLGTDHNPIMLTYGDMDFKKSYFMFEQWWLGVDGFKERVKEWWASFNVTGSPTYILTTKLKLLKGKLKEWEKENKNNRR